MIQELDSFVLILGNLPHNTGITQHGFVVGMNTPHGQKINRILYHKPSGQIQVEVAGGSIDLNENQKEIVIDGYSHQCRIALGNVKKRRPDAPPPLKRREPTGYKNPLTGESYETSRLKAPAMGEELKLVHDYLTESERKNKVLTEKLDSMRNAYHAECEENARLKNQLPVPYERHEIMVDDSGEQIAVYETNDVEFLQNRNRELENANREKATIVRWYERRLEDEKKVSSHLTDEDRFKATMSGALGSAGAGAIVYSLFNIFF